MSDSSWTQCILLPSFLASECYLILGIDTESVNVFTHHLGIPGWTARFPGMNEMVTWGLYKIEEWAGLREVCSSNGKPTTLRLTSLLIVNIGPLVPNTFQGTLKAQHNTCVLLVNFRLQKTLAQQHTGKEFLKYIIWRWQGLETRKRGSGEKLGSNLMEPNSGWYLSQKRTSDSFRN